jgi:hypothetical protein
VPLKQRHHWPSPHSAVVPELVWARPLIYRHHLSELGEFSLSSDSIAYTYRYVKATAPIIRAVPHEEMESFYSLACTIGGYIVFPAKKINGKATINGARGLN